MTVLAKRNGSLFPSLVSDFFGTDDFFGADLIDLNRNLLKWDRTWNVPSVNIRENEKSFAFELAAPGLAKKDFRIEVDTDGVMTISAEKMEEKNEEDKDFTRKEFSYNTFSRSFQLPENIHSDKVEAKYEDGILKLTVPKKEIKLAKPKKEIKIA